MSNLTREDLAEALLAVASKPSSGYRVAMKLLAELIDPATVEAHEAQAVEPAVPDWRSRSTVGEWWTDGNYFYEITAVNAKGFGYKAYRVDGTVFYDQTASGEWTDFTGFTRIPRRPAERDGWRPKWEVKQFADGEIPNVPFFDPDGLLAKHTGGVHGKRFDGWRWLAERVELTGLAMLRADKPGTVRVRRAGAEPGVFVRQNGYIQYIPTYGVGAVNVPYSPDIADGLTNENCPVVFGGAA